MARINMEQIEFFGLSNMDSRICGAITRQYPVDAFDVNSTAAEYLKDCAKLAVSALEVLKSCASDVRILRS